VDTRPNWSTREPASADRRYSLRLLREPLVHFLLIGAALFALFDLAGGDRGSDSRRIEITDGVVADIVQRYSEVWRRPPSAPELQALLDSYIQEEVLYREGVAQGLLEDDPVIRRRVRQKMDVLGEESRESTPPTEAELQSWLDSHGSLYANPPVLSFTQVMFDPAKTGAGTEAAMVAAKARLIAGADPSSVGEASLLPGTHARVGMDRVARDFGEEFANSVAKLPAGSWQGPVRSGLGLHLVRISERLAGRPAKLADVRSAVERDWESNRRDRAAAAYYRDLRRDYDVVLKADLPAAARPETAR
jgi:hypothetical protein